MKKIFYGALFALMIMATSCHKGIWNALDALDVRVTNLENLCKEMNTNISSLQTIVNVLQANDYITAVTEITKSGETIGYTITFGKHNPITIYNGEDGKDGTNGTNGKDGADGKDGKDGTSGSTGTTPVIGVAQDTDGVYYWTLNGSWLLDDNGNKMRVTGKDGANGTNGTNGTNGKDGVSPKLKIEDDYWYISYDNGSNWTMLGKATGADGKNGQDGDGMFKSVTQDDQFVYFTLANDEMIQVAKYSRNIVGYTGDTAHIVNGAIERVFSVSDSAKVYFSQGFLQYNAVLGTHSCADGTTKQGIWRFAEHQWDVISEDSNYLASSTYNGWIDGFCWGTSGWFGTYYQPYNRYGNHVGLCQYSLVGDYAYGDWGVYNPISNGGNATSMWRTLTDSEWQYIYEKRPNANKQKAIVTLNPQKDVYIKGIVIFPDDMYDENLTWYADSYAFNFVDSITWHMYEQVGVVFLPNATYCWTPINGGQSTAYAVYMGHYLFSSGNFSKGETYRVRLVKDVEQN